MSGTGTEIKTSNCDKTSSSYTGTYFIVVAAILTSFFLIYVVSSGKKFILLSHTRSLKFHNIEIQKTLK